MRVFVTGATGFIGSAIVKELIGAGHQVVGLARSEANAQALTAAGAAVHRGDLENLKSLQSGAAAADAVIHAGFIHDFSRFKEVCEIDRVAIEAMGSVLAGSNKPFVITSGTALVSPGKMATEDIIPAPGSSPHPRMSEQAADAVAKLGVCTSVIRLSPSVHGDGDKHGFIPMLIDIARKKGSAAYIADAANRWTAVHRLDAAKLYRLALEKNTVAGNRFHGVAESEVVFKDIAAAIGKQLNLPLISVTPEAAAEYFGWFNGFASIDCPASSVVTVKMLNWHPSEATLLEDMENGVYA